MEDKRLRGKILTTKQLRLQGLISQHDCDW